MKMPVLQPISIPTKDLPWYKALYCWMSTIRRWRLMRHFDYKLEDGTVVRIPKGFIFDGASIPRIFWAVLSPTGLLLIPGLLHDYAYKYDYLLTTDMYGQQLPVDDAAGRKHWDKMFREEAIRVNGFHVINYIAWLSLRAGGWMAWNKHRHRLVTYVDEY